MTTEPLYTSDADNENPDEFDALLLSVASMSTEEIDAWRGSRPSGCDPHRHACAVMDWMLLFPEDAAMARTWFDSDLDLESAARFTQADWSLDDARSLRKLLFIAVFQGVTTSATAERDLVTGGHSAHRVLSYVETHTVPDPFSPAALAIMATM